MHRRNFLYSTTAAVGGAGLVAVAWPFIDQMNPDAAVRAAGDIVEIPLADLRPDQLRIVRWQNLPIFVVKRTAKMLEAMQEQKLVNVLIDPLSEGRQQPPYAKNWHRSINSTYAVLVGVCTSCRCIPQYVANDPIPPNLIGGYFCPCCASRYDPAGRAYHGPARYNLAVPPHNIEDQSRILIGKNASGIIFSIKSIERI